VLLPRRGADNPGKNGQKGENIPVPLFARGRARRETLGPRCSDRTAVVEVPGTHSSSISARRW
jgi:hypothetical protein